MITTILFDWDGTVQQTIPVWVRAHQIVFRRYGFELTEDEVLKSVFHREPSKREIIKASDAESFWKELINIVEPMAIPCPLYPEVEKLLEQTQPYKKAVVTGSYGPIVEKTIQHYGLVNDFQFVLGEEDVHRSKPNSEIVFSAMNKLKSQPEETVVIGDMAKDILAGKNAGTKTVLYLPEINEEYYDFEILRQARADFEISTHLQLLDILEKT